MRLIRLIRLLTASVGPFDTRGLVPGDDLGVPASQGAAQGVDFGGTRVVLEVFSELGDEPAGEVGVVDGVDLTDHFFGVPGGLDLPTRLPCPQQADELGVAGSVETFVGSGQQAADPSMADRPCGPDDPTFRSGPSFGIRRVSGWPT